MTDTDTELLASSPRKLFVERTEAYNAEVKRTIAESGRRKIKILRKEENSSCISIVFLLYYSSRMV